MLLCDIISPLFVRGIERRECVIDYAHIQLQYALVITQLVQYLGIQENSCFSTFNIHVAYRAHPEYPKEYDLGLAWS